MSAAAAASQTAAAEKTAAVTLRLGEARGAPFVCRRECVYVRPPYAAVLLARGEGHQGAGDWRRMGDGPGPRERVGGRRAVAIAHAHGSAVNM